MAFLFCGISVANAQLQQAFADTPGISPEIKNMTSGEQTRSSQFEPLLFSSVGVGPSFIMQPTLMRNFWHTGVAAGGSIQLQFSPMMAIEVGLAVNAHRLDTGKIRRERDPDASRRISSAEFAHFHVSTIFFPQRTFGILEPYFKMGVGYTGADVEPVPGNRDQTSDLRRFTGSFDAFSFSGVIGMETRVSSTYWLYLEGNYTHVFAPNRAVIFAGLHFGLRILAF